MSASKTPKPHVTGDGIRRRRAIPLIAAIAGLVAVQPAWSALQDSPTASNLPGGANTTRSVALGDLDGDGNIDLVVANEANNETNQIFWGDGDGNFSAGQNLDSTTATSDSVDLGDVDGDGDLDILIGNRNNAPTRLYENQGSRNFNLLATNAISNETGNRQTSEARFGDLNMDNDPDVVISNRNSANQVFVAAAGAGFPTFFNLGQSGATDSSSVAIGHLNDDPAPDLIIGNRENARNDLYINNGSAQFPTRRDLSPHRNYTDWVEIVDLNNDGWGDVVISNRQQPNQFLINNQSDNNNDLFYPARLVSPDADYTRELRPVDVDGDGDMDLVAANDSFAQDKIYLNLFVERGLPAGSRDVTFSAGIAFTGGDINESTSLDFADVDNDGDIDLVIGNNGSANRLFINRNSTPSFVTPAVDGATVGSPYEYTIITTDRDFNQDLEITGTVPGWLTLTDNGDRTATLSGTPGAAGDFAVDLTVSDGSANASQQFDITVDASNAAPTITSDEPPTSITQGTNGNPNQALTQYSHQVTATDDAGGLVITAPVKPVWMSISDNGNGTATLGGSPTQYHLGNHDLVVRVTDAGGRVAEQAVVVTVVDGNDRPQPGDDLICLSSAGDSATALSEDHPYYGMTTLLWNDVDPEGNTIVATGQVTQGPQFGTATVNADGTFEYQHDGSAATSDSFLYQINDGNGGSNRGQVRIRFNADPLCTIGADTTPPTITVDPAEVTILLGETWDDEAALDGVSALDNVDGNITGNIVIGGDVVDTNTAGEYEVAYNVSDAAGNAANTAFRTVNVVTDAPPVITITGDNPVEVTLGSEYEDAGATALDDEDGDLTGQIQVDSNVDTDTVGIYEVTYTVTDSGANEVSAVRTVNVVGGPDTSPPVITVTGSNPVTVVVGSGYTDEGATATDNVDGDLTASIVTENTVDPDTVGAYTVTYTVSDAAGNEASATRTVNIVAEADTTPPVITLIGDAEITLSAGDTYTEEGATATDNVEGDISANVVIGGDTVDTDTVGTYVVTYNVSDSSGNAAEEVTRTVIVEEAADAAPVITILGSNPATVTQGNTYTDAGATAEDAEDGDISDDIDVDNNVNTNAAGNYTVVYTVTDSAGNTTTATRNVTVQASNNGGGSSGGGGGAASITELLGLLMLLSVVMSGRSWRLHRRST